MSPPESEVDLRALAQLPRPWDPATCTGRLREELWAWLDQVAIWINEQHLWNVARPGIPECWPAHPHLVHDLAVLACSPLLHQLRGHSRGVGGLAPLRAAAVPRAAA